MNHLAKRLVFTAALLLSASAAYTPLSAAGTEVEAPFFSRVRGGVEVVFEHSLEDVTKAVSKSLDKMKFTKISVKSDVLVSVFVATTAEEKKIKIKVTKISAESSKINVQVGLVGDEAVTRALVDKIKSEL